MSDNIFNMGATVAYTKWMREGKHLKVKTTWDSFLAGYMACQNNVDEQEEEGIDKMLKDVKKSEDERSIVDIQDSCFSGLEKCAKQFAEITSMVSMVADLKTITEPLHAECVGCHRAVLRETGKQMPSGEYVCDDCFETEFPEVKNHNEDANKER